MPEQVDAWLIGSLAEGEASVEFELVSPAAWSFAKAFLLDGRGYLHADYGTVEVAGKDALTVLRDMKMAGLKIK